MNDISEFITKSALALKLQMSFLVAIYNILHSEDTVVLRYFDLHIPGLSPLMNKG